MSARNLHTSFHRIALALLASGLSALALAPAHAALPEGLSGAWYNPAQEGHVLSIALVDDGQRAVVIWHVFDPAGQPLTLYIDGRVRGREIVGPAYAPRGMRFGEFDPAAVDVPEWGEVVLRFDDCRNATLGWDARAEGYADGSMAIEPLARIDSLPCSLPPEAGVKPGLYGASAIVDREGRLWAAAAPEFQPPSTEPRAEVAVAEATAVEGSSVSMTLFYGPAGGARLTRLDGGVVAGSPNDLRFPLNNRVVFPPPPNTIFPSPPPTRQPIRGWQFGTPRGAVLQAPVDLASLAGEYRLPWVANANESRLGRIEVAEDGTLCARYRPAEQAACDVEGTLSTPEGEFGLVDMVIRDRADPERITYRGRGWQVTVDGVQRLYLVGTDGDTGFLLYGLR